MVLVGVGAAPASARLTPYDIGEKRYATEFFGAFGAWEIYRSQAADRRPVFCHAVIMSLGGDRFTVTRSAAGGRDRLGITISPATDFAKTVQARITVRRGATRAHLDTRWRAGPADLWTATPASFANRLAAGDVVDLHLGASDRRIRIVWRDVDGLQHGFAQCLSPRGDDAQTS